MSEFSNLSSLKLLRSVDLLSRLTILQLSQIANSLSEISYSDGQSIVEQVMLLLEKGLFLCVSKMSDDLFLVLPCSMIVYLHCT